MRIFHGSYTMIEHIDLSKGRLYRDFGQGFYATKIFRHAERWAERKGKEHQTEGVVTEFEFVDGAYAENICKIKRFDGYNEEWFDFVLLNCDKKQPHPVHDYDIVEGPVANDDVQNRMKDYMRGKVSKADFLEELKWHEETHQICFCSLLALQMLERLDDTPVWDITKITQPLLKALMHDKHVSEMKAADLFFTSKVFVQLENKETKLYQQSWTAVYDMLKKELMSER